MTEQEQDWIRDGPQGAEIFLWVQPRAAGNQVVGVRNNSLALRLTAPPVEGAANKACREYMAELLGVSRGAVELVGGHSHRRKRVLIRGYSAEAIRKALQDVASS